LLGETTLATLGANSLAASIERPKQSREMRKTKGGQGYRGAMGRIDLDLVELSRGK